MESLKQDLDQNLFQNIVLAAKQGLEVSPDRHITRWCFEVVENLAGAAGKIEHTCHIDNGDIYSNYDIIDNKTLKKIRSMWYRIFNFSVQGEKINHSEYFGILKGIADAELFATDPSESKNT